MKIEKRIRDFLEEIYMQGNIPSKEEMYQNILDIVTAGDYYEGFEEGYKAALSDEDTK